MKKTKKGAKAPQSIKVTYSGRVMFEAERQPRQRRLFLFSVTLGQLDREDPYVPGRPANSGVYRGLAANAEEALALTLAARVKEDEGRRWSDAGQREGEASPPAPSGREAFERLGLVVLDLTCHGTADWVHVRAWGRR